MNFLKSLGINARRGQQYKGTPDSPDIIHDLKGIHFEVKRTEQLRVFDYLSQAEAEAPTNDLPLVAWKRNRKPWLIIVNAEKLITFIQNYENLIRSRMKINPSYPPQMCIIPSLQVLSAVCGWYFLGGGG